jgi:outer membrane autotransporter protein
MAEEGAGDASLTLRKQTGESLASRLGVNLSWSHAGRHGVTLIPRVDVAWRHEFKDAPLEIEAELGSAALTLLGRKPDEDGLQAALGLDAIFRNGLAAHLRFSGEWTTAASEALEIRGGLEFRF